MRFFTRIVFAACVASAPALAPTALAQTTAELPAPEGMKITPSHAPLVAPAAPGAFVAGPGTMKLLEKLEARYKGEKTLHIVFTQKRNDKFFPDGAVNSKGELWYEKPDHFRCDYADPEPVVNLMNGMTFYNYVPELKQAEVWKFRNAAERDQQIDQIMIGFGADKARVLQRYEVVSSDDDTSLALELKKRNLDATAEEGSTEKQALVHVKPRAGFAESSSFMELKLTIDKASLKPEKIWYEDASESSVELTVSKVETGVAAPDGLFDKDKAFPDGTNFIDKTEE